MFWHGHYSLMYGLLELLALHWHIGSIFDRLHQVDEFTAFLVSRIDRRLQRIRRTARLRPDQIARLVRRNGEEPRTKSARWIKLFYRLMNLKKRFLKHIFGRCSITEKSNQEMEQLALIARHERGEALLVTGAIVSKKLLVGSLFAVHGACGEVGCTLCDGRDCQIIRAVGSRVVCAAGLVRQTTHCTLSANQLRFDPSTHKWSGVSWLSPRPT